MTDTEKLISALEFALEMQGSVEDARPLGHGAPKNTLAWMDAAESVIQLVKHGG